VNIKRPRTKRGVIKKKDGEEKRKKEERKEKVK